MSKPTQSERSIQKSIRNWLVGQGYEVIKLTTLGRYGTAGWPDLMVLDEAPQLPLFLEVKTEFGDPTPIQEDKIKKLRGRGYPTFIVRSLVDAKLVIEAWQEFRMRVKK
jgi:Holliday junction resolvase